MIVSLRQWDRLLPEYKKFQSVANNFRLAYFVLVPFGFFMVTVLQNTKHHFETVPTYVFKVKYVIIPSPNRITKSISCLPLVSQTDTVTPPQSALKTLRPPMIVTFRLTLDVNISDNTLNWPNVYSANQEGSNPPSS